MQPVKILVVDDDPLNIEVIQAYLEMEGYAISAVHSGERALGRVEDIAPDLILLDVRMSGMSGYETCMALKGNPKTAMIPVLMVTAFQDREDIDQAVEAGTDDILFKPIKPALLMLRVRNLVRLKLLQDQVDG